MKRPHHTLSLSTEAIVDCGRLFCRGRVQRYIVFAQKIRKGPVHPHDAEFSGTYDQAGGSGLLHGIEDIVRRQQMPLFSPPIRLHPVRKEEQIAGVRDSVNDHFAE